MKKKHIFASLLASMFCIGMTSAPCRAIDADVIGNASSFVKGDVNDDGDFNISDVVQLQKWLLAVPDTHLANWKAADFCDDVFDLTLMKRALIYGELVQSTSPTTQHIGLNHTNEVTELLNNYDLNDYDEIYRESLSKMFERFNKDGYIYTFAGSDSDGNAITLREDHPNAPIVLMPYMDYEDTGILYHVAYKGKYYQVYYYFTDPAYPASDLWDYLENQRMRYKSISLIDEKFGIVDSSTDKQFDMCAFYEIDDAHYCKVRTYESEEALIDFLQVLNDEKIEIKNKSDELSSSHLQTPPETNSYLFDSYNALSDALTKPDSSIIADSNNYGELFNKTVSAFNNKTIDLYIPSVDGNACALRNKEGFSNISVMTAELYNLPWIWYHCKVNDNDVDVKIAYHSIIENAELNSAKTYYDVLKLIAPDAPNPDNFAKFESYLNIYESEINLANGKKADAMISETTNNKVYVMFIYEGKLISVYADKDTLSESFWSSFSLVKY